MASAALRCEAGDLVVGGCEESHQWEAAPRERRWAELFEQLQRRLGRFDANGYGFQLRAGLEEAMDFILDGWRCWKRGGHDLPG